VDFILLGVPSLLFQAGFIMLFSLPIWLAARIVGAEYPTLWRSALALVLGFSAALASVAFAGGWGVLIAPVVFLLVFKYLLGTSFVGAIVLVVLAMAGYAALAHLFGPAAAGLGGGAAGTV
jgi:hypothetical protein